MALKIQLHLGDLCCWCPWRQQAAIGLTLCSPSFPFGKPILFKTDRPSRHFCFWISPSCEIYSEIYIYIFYIPLLLENFQLSFLRLVMRRWFIISFTCWFNDTLCCRKMIVVYCLCCTNTKVVIFSLIRNSLFICSFFKPLLLILDYVELAVQVKHNLSFSGNIQSSLWRMLCFGLNISDTKLKSCFHSYWKSV